MTSFPNTLGLFAGMAVVNNDATIPATAVLKAVVRDLKKYMKLKNEINGQRILPIGYDAAASGARDKQVLDYLTTGDEETSIDFCAVSTFINTLKDYSPLTRIP